MVIIVFRNIIVILHIYRHVYLDWISSWVHRAILFIFSMYSIMKPTGLFRAIVCRFHHEALLTMQSYRLSIPSRSSPGSAGFLSVHSINKSTGICSIVVRLLDQYACALRGYSLSIPHHEARWALQDYCLSIPSWSLQRTAGLLSVYSITKPNGLCRIIACLFQRFVFSIKRLCVYSIFIFFGALTYLQLDRFWHLFPLSEKNWHNKFNFYYTIAYYFLQTRWCQPGLYYCLIFPSNPPVSTRVPYQISKLIPPVSTWDSQNLSRRCQPGILPIGTRRCQPGNQFLNSSFSRRCQPGNQSF